MSVTQASTTNLRMNVDQGWDPNDELYLHHSDHPTTFCSSKLLDGENLNHWQRVVEVSLLAKNKLGFVKGTC